MNIIELRANNFARLSAVTIRPDSALIQITGKNGQGKSSCLNAIWTALVGRSAAPVQPIRKGAEQATIKLDLGAMTIVRTFKTTDAGYTTDLKVTMADGGRVGTKPQAVIDALLGDLSFNPLEFAKLAAKDQFERVKRLVPGFDFDDNAKQRQNAFDERTVANRKAKDAAARAQGIMLPPGPKPQVPDVKELSAALTNANAHNDAVRRADHQRGMDGAALDALLDEIEVQEAKLVSLKQRAADEKARLEALPPLPEMINVDDIAAQIMSADGLRATAARHEERERHISEAEEAERLATTLSHFIEECDAEKRRAIEGAEMPVQGLTFGEDAVLLNGIPFADAGTAEKIVASMQIGMALNPQLRVMLIDEGSELDSKSLALVAGIATDHKYQVWLTRVEESGKVGFVIEDGALKGSTP